MEEKYELLVEYIDGKENAIIRKFELSKSNVEKCYFEDGIRIFILNDNQSFAVSIENLISFEYKKIEYTKDDGELQKELKEIAKRSIEDKSSKLIEYINIKEGYRVKAKKMTLEKFNKKHSNTTDAYIYNSPDTVGYEITDEEKKSQTWIREDKFLEEFKNPLCIDYHDLSYYV